MGVSGRKYTSDALHKQALVTEYTYSYQQLGMPYGDARKRAEEFVQAGVAEVVSRGWQNQPADCGDLMLKDEHTNKELAAYLTSRRREGATDDDIRWWWNMPPLDRVLVEKSDEELCLSAFAMCMEKGMEAADAAKYVFKANPKYGDLLDTDDPDRPLPIELKRRIIEWSEKHYNDLGLLRSKLEEATSFNALVRSEVISPPAGKNQKIAFEPGTEQGILVGIVVVTFMFGGIIGLAWLLDRSEETQSVNERYSLEAVEDREKGSQVPSGSAVVDVTSGKEFQQYDEGGSMKERSALSVVENGKADSQIFVAPTVTDENSSMNLQHPNDSSLIEQRFIVPPDCSGREHHPLIYVSVDKNTDFRVWFKGSSKRPVEELKLDGLAGDRVYFVKRDGDAIYASVFELTRDDLNELRLVTGSGCGVFTDRILETRTWFDSSGKFSRDAVFAGRSGTAVFLWLVPQQYLLAVGIESLSQADRAYVNANVLTVVAHEVAR